MGLFDKIFGNREKIEKTNIRDHYKGEKYFNKEIVRFSDIIKETIQETNLNAFNYWAISAKYQQIISLKFSLGIPVFQIVEDYSSALNYYIKGWDEKEATYADMLLMISLGILFQVSDGDFELLVEYVEKTDANKKLDNWHPDGLIWFLLNSRSSHQSKATEILFPRIYGSLYEITKLSKPDAESALEKYLEKWYNLHKGDPWYNTHERDRGYCGYWAWEVAAVVKVMGLNDSSFKDNIYYPYDMVHWKGNVS